MDWSDLLDCPTLLHVFDFLKPSDLCTGVGLVCRRWRAVMKNCELWFRIYRASRIRPVEWKHVPEDDTGKSCGITMEADHMRNSRYAEHKEILRWGSTYNATTLLLNLPQHSRYERCNHGKCMKPICVLYGTNFVPDWGPKRLHYCTNTWHWKKHRFSVISKKPSKDYHREFVKDALAVASSQSNRTMMNVHPVRGPMSRKYQDVVHKANKYLKRKEVMQELESRTERLCEIRDELFPESRRKRKRKDNGDIVVHKKSKKETYIILKYMNV